MLTQPVNSDRRLYWILACYVRFTEFAKTASSRLYQNNKIAIVTGKFLRVKINRTKFCVLLRKVNEVQQRNHRHETLKFHNILPLQKFVDNSINYDFFARRVL